MEPEEQKILRGYFSSAQGLNGKISVIPSKEKRKKVVLAEIAKRFVKFSLPENEQNTPTASRLEESADKMLRLYANGGFVSRTVKDGVVIAMTGDTAKWAQWQTDHPASAEPTTPTKTDAERIAELEAALAAMKEATN